jgi:dolichyl-phosphate-mannose-protein mannosyltransferase
LSGFVQAVIVQKNLSELVPTKEEELSSKSEALGFLGGGWEGLSTFVLMRTSNILLACVLAVVGAIATRGITKGEFSYNVDETQHAVTGLYAADLLRDHPFRHPVQYTYRYYAQYPALSGVIHWPPLFYGVEGVCFLVLGRGVESAHLSVLLFAVLGLVFWFRLIRYLLNKWAAALTTLLLGLLPSVLLFEKAVMLEVPSLALCIAATYFWIRFLLEENIQLLAWFAGFASAALLTKQNSIYLLVFCVLSILFLGKYRLLATRRAILLGALACIVVAPYYVAAYMIHWRTIAMDLSEQSRSLSQRLLFYPQALPNQLGWTLLALAALGIATARWWSSRPGAANLMLTWILSCYLTFTVIGHQESRYILYWIPAFLYFAGGILTNDQLWRSGRIWKVAASILLATTTVLSALAFERPQAEGYEPATRWITGAAKQGVILYDGDLPGNFIFFLRVNDPGRRFAVLRKALYAYRLKSQGGSEELIHSPEDLRNVIQGAGVRFVVVESNRRLVFADQYWLGELLKTPQFRLAATFPIITTDGNVRHSQLLCYENIDWRQPTEKNLRVRMLTLDHDIVIPFDELLGDRAK